MSDSYPRIDSFKQFVLKGEFKDGKHNDKDFIIIIKLQTNKVKNCDKTCVQHIKKPIIFYKCR